MDSGKPLLEFTAPLQYVKGVGPARRAEFEKAGLRTVEDLLYYMPFRYEDRSTIRPIRSVAVGERALVSGRVVATDVKKTRRPQFKLFRAVVEDSTGRIQVVWFNQPYLADVVVPDYEICLYGEVRASPAGGGVLEMTNPHFEVGKDSRGETGIVPVYERVGSVPGKAIRRIVKGLLERYELRLKGQVPMPVLKRQGLLPPAEALVLIHCPGEGADVEALNRGAAREQRSLVFDEFFFLQAGLAYKSFLRGAEGGGKKGIAFQTSPRIREALKSVLPFKLTAGQKAALREIVDDMVSPNSMRRLLQGDVGCGKTIVALLAAALAIENNYQVAFMAPTEILAEQHLVSVRDRYAATGYRVAGLVGSMSDKEKAEVKGALLRGDVDLIVGTHALIQGDVAFKKLGLVIIDEQHRFGVLQRGELMGKGAAADLLILTATPIPRSLTLTVFGDLGLSVIRDMPPGRQPVVTAVRTERSLAKIAEFLEDQIAQGRQVYAVAPAIEDSEVHELESAEGLCERLQALLPRRSVGLLHGRMPAGEKEEIMASFAAGKLDLLAGTTVIEVGVDVPNASVMLIFNAERFGLSQLHQLRGRIGRGGHRGYCILLYKPTRGEDARQRLALIEQTGDGFKIAEKDLELRGPGDFFGTRQSGMPALRVGNIIRDVSILKSARDEAFRLMLSPGEGEAGLREELVAELKQKWSGRFGLVLVG